MKIDIKPLSTNALWRGGRRYKTKEYISYIEEMSYLLPKNLKLDLNNINIILHLKSSTYNKSDTDNYIKPILDILVKNGIIKDDRYITKITVEKRISDNYCIEIF